MKNHFPVWGPLTLMLLFSRVHTCPDCSDWTGSPADVCGTDGITYSSDCELLKALCTDDTITLGPGTDINTLPIALIVQNYKMNEGACINSGGGGNCPNCTSIVTTIPVCDSSLTEFNSSCAMAQLMCEEGIISYDDGIDFSAQTEADYRIKVSSYVYWNGKCSGDCPAGEASSTGQYGPCTECAPGSSAASPGATSCELCAKDTYQPDSGALACIPCPNGMDTLDTGADNVSLCLPDCLPGHYSSTGNAPCTKCAAGTFTDASNTISCTACGVGKYTDGRVCEPCPAGSSSNAATAPITCTDCSVGTFSNVTGSDTCEPCSLGRFMNSTGSDACEPCGPGTFNDVTGATSCEECTVGHYQIELGRSFCYTCPQGTYQPSKGASKCVNCLKGYYQDTEGLTACSRCPDRMTTVTEGSVSFYDCHYTSCMTGSKVVVVNGRVTCEACPVGYYQNVANSTSCSTCPQNTYQSTEGSTSCTRCPENSVTYLTGSTEADDCEGPMITLYSGVNYVGSETVLYDKRNYLASNLRGKVSSFKVSKGDWYVFTGTYYGGSQLRLNQGVKRSDTSNSNQYPSISGLSRAAFQSIRPVVTNSMCYTENGLYYTGYRLKTKNGIVCQNWKATTPHASINAFSGQGIGNHNYCRNPDNDPKGPWCYTTDPKKKWGYCGVPKCKWNVDCYTERGEFYRGYRAKTSGNKYNCNNWNSDWPHPHSYDNSYNDRTYGTGNHRYCRNPDPKSDNRPWCYTTYFFKRWTYCSVPKCESSSISYF